MLERSKGDSTGKAALRQLKNQLEDAECARAAAIKAKQALEQELNETQATLEEAMRHRSEAEERANAANRERTELLSQLEENEEELAEVRCFIYPFIYSFIDIVIQYYLIFNHKLICIDCLSHFDLRLLINDFNQRQLLTYNLSNFKDIKCTTVFKIFQINRDISSNESSMSYMDYFITTKGLEEISSRGATSFRGARPIAGSTGANCRSRSGEVVIKGPTGGTNAAIRISGAARRSYGEQPRHETLGVPCQGTRKQTRIRTNYESTSGGIVEEK